MKPSGFDGRDMLTIVYFAVLAAISVATGFLIGGSSRATRTTS